MSNCTSKHADTTTERIARKMLARLAEQGPMTLADLARGDRIPGAGTIRFAEAFAVLTKGGLVRWAGDVPLERNRQVPAFEATGEGKALALKLAPVEVSP